MYISVTNAIYNITLVFQYIGNYNDADRLGTMALSETEKELWKIPLDMIGSFVNTYVYTGTTNGSRSRGLSSKPEIYGYMQFKTHLVWLSWFE